MKTNSVRRNLLATLAAISASIAVLPSTALALQENSTNTVNLDAKSVAVKGHDVVAYFTSGAPMVGKIELSVTHEGAQYLFANEAHRDAFKASPEKYLPQFGGFCAMGVAMGKKFDIDPTAWKVVDNKLYLNLNADVQKAWVADIPGNLVKGNDAWPKIKAKTAKQL